MRQFFSEMDKDMSGTINLDEIILYFDDPTVASYFKYLGLDAHDTERLFCLLDADDSGELTLDEFLAGCLRLKGVARSIDVYTLIRNCNSIQMQLNQLITSERQ